MEKQNQTDNPSMHQKYKYDIMMSYTQNDRDIVYRIQQYLADHGLHIWFDRSRYQKKGKMI